MKSAGSTTSSSPPACWLVVCLLLLAPPAALAEQFHAGFDGDETSWSVQYDRSKSKLLSHRRHRHVVAAGQASEHLEVVVGRQGSVVQLEHELPPARVIDDLQLSLWCRSNRPGATLALRMVFPRQKDPATNAVLSTWIVGDAYSRTGRWQRLECRTNDDVVRDRLRLLRARLKNRPLDTRDVYVDRAILRTDASAGTIEYFVDELEFGPVVDPREDVPVQQAGHDDSRGMPSPVELRLDRLYVEGRPFFPRFTPHHGESPASLRKHGLNVVWVPSYEDSALLDRLHAHDLWAMATPPRAVGADDRVLDASRASLIPLTDSTLPVLFWYGGTRVKADARKDVASWAAQVQRADRLRRPMIVDVAGREREFSRHVPVLGTSHHPLHTSLSLMDYRNWLRERGRLARPGTFRVTWLQTEPSRRRADWREARLRERIVVEPEQIRLLAYAALSAGCRGIGFWKTTSLDEERAGADERRLAIAEVNLELELLAPLLARGTVQTHVPVQVQPPGVNVDRSRIDFRQSAGRRRQREALLDVKAGEAVRKELGTGGVDAAVIRFDEGLLLLPVWYDAGAQFVPGQMASNDARLVVPGAHESASVWQVKTTGIRSLERRRVAGGLEITLDKFDQTAAILVTTDRELVDRFRKRIAETAPQASRTAVELARAKLERVRRVDRQLTSMGFGQADGPQLLGRAESLVTNAHGQLERSLYEVAQQSAHDALQLVRILQRAHWEQALQRLSSPLSSPYTTCFQTLPDHWRLLSRIGRSLDAQQENLLRSGDFEDVDTMLIEGWQHVQNEVPGLDAGAELTADEDRKRYRLRLFASRRPGETAPRIVPEPPVVVHSPKVTVRSGQVVHVSGMYRLVTPVSGSLDGVMVYDDLAGRAGGLRLEGTDGWQRFELIREVNHTGPVGVTIALTGTGDVQFDDVRIVAFQEREHPVRPAAHEEDEQERGGFLQRLDLLDRWPLRRRSRR